MTFAEAVAALGYTGATNSITQLFTPKKAGEAYKMAKDEGIMVWGIYAYTQEAAAALAAVFGNTSPPEVHKSGQYGHYHPGGSSNESHTFHIWFGGVLNY